MLEFISTSVANAGAAGDSAGGAARLKKVNAEALRTNGLGFLLPPSFPESGATPAVLCELLDLPTLPSRPRTAVGTWLRIVTINDVYKLEHYSQFKTAVCQCKAMAAAQDAVCISTLNGDFLSPCIITSLDGGTAMTAALEVAGVDYACLGNHEIDLGFEGLGSKLKALTKCKVLNTNVANPELAHLPRKDVINVGHRSVLLGGFLTEDESIYPPSTMPEFTPITQSIIDLWEEEKQAGLTHDLFVPMTHQLNTLDQEVRGSASRTPLTRPLRVPYVSLTVRPARRSPNTPS